MWKRIDVDRTKQYQIALCQRPDGHRSQELHCSGAPALPTNAVFLTEIAPIDLVMRGDVCGIAKVVKLDTGQGYWVDAHGLWLTNDEVEALSEEREVPWVNGLAAHFAPK